MKCPSTCLRTATVQLAKAVPVRLQIAQSFNQTFEENYLFSWGERKERRKHNVSPTQSLGWKLQNRPPRCEEWPKAESTAILITDLQDNGRTRLWPKAITLTRHQCSRIDFRSSSLSCNSLKAFHPEEQTSKLCTTILNAVLLNATERTIFRLQTLRD